MYPLQCHRGVGWCAYIQCTTDYHARRINLDNYMTLDRKGFDATITFNRNLYIAMSLEIFSKMN